MGNAAIVATLAIRSYCLSLSLGFMSNLNISYWVLTMSWNLISYSEGFNFVIRNGSCYKDNRFR